MSRLLQSVSSRPRRRAGVSPARDASRVRNGAKSRREALAGRGRRSPMQTAKLTAAESCRQRDNIFERGARSRGAGATKRSGSSSTAIFALFRLAIE